MAERNPGRDGILSGGEMDMVMICPEKRGLEEASISRPFVVLYVFDDNTTVWGPLNTGGRGHFGVKVCGLVGPTYGSGQSEKGARFGAFLLVPLGYRIIHQHCGYNSVIRRCEYRFSRNGVYSPFPPHHLPNQFEVKNAKLLITLS